MPARAPLSFQQQWLWNLVQQYRDWSCVLGYAYRLSGVLDVDALEMSLKQVSGRHGSLRTTIVIDDTIAHQEVSELSMCRLEVIDVSGHSAAQIEAKGQSLLQEFCARDIDPTVLPPLKARLFKLAHSEHFFALAVHRIIADCYSMDQVLEELWNEYTSAAKRLRSEPATPAPPYSDYALRQNQKHPEWLKKHRGYWQERLEGASILRFLHEEPPVSVTRGTVAEINLFLGAELSASLQDAARRARTLSANLMLALYVAVLSKWCNQRDFIVPCNVAGRQSENKNVVGYFSHILLLRMKLTGNESFEELLSLVSNEFFRALSHQDFGMMAMRHPELLAGTYFQWVSWRANAPSPALGTATREALELTTERVHVREFGNGILAIPPGMVDVEMTFFDTDEGIYASGAYRADRFTSRTMEQFMRELQSTAERLIADIRASTVVNVS